MIIKFIIAKLGLILLVAAASILGISSNVVAADKVKLLTDWIYGGKHTPFFVARDKGFFKNNGLDVTIVQERGSEKAAKFVDAKKVDYSFGDFLKAVKLISKGGKIRSISAGHTFQAGGFIFLEGSGIRGPKDLEGKRFGTFPSDVGNTLLPALAAASGIDHKQVIIKIMNSAVRIPALFEGKVDFMSGGHNSSIPRMKIIFKRQGKKLKSLYYFKDMGLETYGHTIQTHVDRIESNPDQVRRFVTSVIAAWTWSIKNPKKAFNIFIKANPEKDREISWVQMLEGLADVQDPEIRKFGLGYMKEGLVKKSVETANNYFKLFPAVDYRITYTNQFINKNL